jgi:DnaJ-class molecular chaperone
LCVLVKSFSLVTFFYCYEMNDPKGYYRALDLSTIDCSVEDIKKKYKERAKVYHPDRDTGNETEFIKLKEAYDVLIDPKKKKLYDNTGLTDEEIGPTMDDFMDGSSFVFMGDGVYMNMEHMENMNQYDTMNLKDIFDSIFELQQEGQKEHTSNQYEHRREKFKKIKIQLSMDDVLFGCTKTVKFSSYEDCHKCQGEGKTASHVLRCLSCDGAGFVRFASSTVVCPSCNGLSNLKKSYSQCKSCQGKGSHKIKKSVQISIEPGKPDDTEDTFPEEKLIVHFIHCFDMNAKIQNRDIHVWDNVSIEELLCGFKHTLHIGTKDKPVQVHKDGYFDPNNEAPSLFKQRGICYTDHTGHIQRGSLCVHYVVDGSALNSKRVQQFHPVFLKMFPKQRTTTS